MAVNFDDPKVRIRIATAAVTEAGREESQVRGNSGEGVSTPALHAVKARLTEDMQKFAKGMRDNSGKAERFQADFKQYSGAWKDLADLNKRGCSIEIKERASEKERLDNPTLYARAAEVETELYGKTLAGKTGDKITEKHRLKGVMSTHSTTMMGAAKKLEDPKVQKNPRQFRQVKAEYLDAVKQYVAARTAFDKVK